MLLYEKNSKLPDGNPVVRGHPMLNSRQIICSNKKTVSYKLLLLIAAAASAALSNADSAASAALPAGAEKDVQCLTLALVATSVEKDPAKQQGIIAEAWFFMGRLDAEAPSIDLKPALSSAFDKMKGNPGTKDIGTACDAEFQKRGADLRNLGG
jgi:hypothetical protein